MENITLSKLQNSKSLDKMKEELKSPILNHGIVWGADLGPNNKAYKWVMDTKAFLLDPRGLYFTNQLFMDKIKKYNPDAIGGLTLASHIIASGLVYFNYDSGKKFDGFLVRRERKKHGMLKLIEGPNIKNKNVVIVDDILNAAGFATKAIEAVETTGCKVVAVVVLVNFESEEFVSLKKKGYNVESIFNLKELGLDTRHTPLKPNMLELRWRYGVVNATDYTAPKSSPEIFDDKIYIGSDQGKMLCIDFSGRILWEFKTDPHPYGVHSSPIIVDEKVIFTGYDGSIYALNKNNGLLIWKNKASSYIGASPIYDPNTKMVYAGLENSTLKGTMAAFDLDGSIAWEFATNNHVACRAAVGKQDIIIFGSNDCFIYACKKTNGEFLWKFRANGEIKGRITINSDFCYTTSFDGFLYCLDLNGNLIWKKKLGNALYSEPIIYKDKVIVGSYSNQLTALDKKNGRILWHFASNDKIQSYPLCSDGVVYFGSHDGSLYAVDVENGQLLWKFMTGGPITSSPRISKNKLFVSSNDGYLYCFERNEK